MSRQGYADPLLRIADGELRIGRYYAPVAAPKRVPLGRIRQATERRMGVLSGRWRIRGSGELRHWFNLDPGRTRKTRAFVLDLGGWTRPVVTPDDPDGFARALEAAGVPLGRAGS